MGRYGKYRRQLCTNETATVVTRMEVTLWAQVIAHAVFLDVAEPLRAVYVMLSVAS